MSLVGGLILLAMFAHGRPAAAEPAAAPTSVNAPTMPREVGIPCTVPGTHLTIQSAVDDAACSLISLMTTDYVEVVTISRSLTMIGLPSSLVGTLAIVGTGTLVEIEGLDIDQGYLFGDGFESGDTSAWSGAQPP